MLRIVTDWELTYQYLSSVIGPYGGLVAGLLQGVAFQFTQGDN